VIVLATATPRADVPLVALPLATALRLPLNGASAPINRSRCPRQRREPANLAGYRCRVSGPQLLGGVVHELPGDLSKALIANATALDAWNDITPLARNEFICWVDDAKQVMTRERRIRRTVEELEEGQRRPCCWPGCKHRERIGR
jgi:hypothetical protein